MKLEVGTKIFYHGDMANEARVGTITKVLPATKYTSESVTIKFDDGRKFDIEKSYFSPEYEGHAGTKFVTLKTYQEYREKFFERKRQYLKSIGRNE